MEPRRAELFPEVAEEPFRSARSAMLREGVLVAVEPRVEERRVGAVELTAAELAVRFDERFRNLGGVLGARIAAEEWRERVCDRDAPRF